MSKTRRTEATIRYSDSSAKCRPGHTLLVGRLDSTDKAPRERQGTCLLPYPNAKAYGSRAVSSNLPSRRNRSGLNSSGSSKTSGS